ncbi:MAG TPA: hypothetical protein VMV82_10840, partial [Candidatus Dormibacteraeota bacterium]|nr:hypothetical protein [Candidatus Dormibacteraeota bacterium]
MKRDWARPRWLGFLGIAITALFVLALGPVLWQVSKLNDEVGINRAGLQREQFAVSLNTDLFATVAQVGELRRIIASRASATTIARERARVGALMLRLDGALRSGAGPKLGALRPWRSAWRAWRDARRPASLTQSIVRLNLMVVRIQAVLDAIEDNSNLSYDRGKVAQNLADIAFSATPAALEAAARARLLVDTAARARTLTMHDRLRLANILVVIRSVFDL